MASHDVQSSGDAPRDAANAGSMEIPLRAPTPPLAASDVETEKSATSLEAAKPQPTAPPQVSDMSAIPNGGARAWLQVLGAFFLFFNSWGIINAFGTYQTYYESALLASSTPSDIAWIGSIQSFCLLLVGPLTGPIYDAGYFRGLVLAGTLFIVIGHMMLSLCSTYWEVLLAQGFCVGIGAGCLFTPSVAILSTYFSTRLASASGLAAAGSSLGGVLYPIILYRLLPQIGFAWATRTLGFIALATLLVSNTCMKVRVLPPAKRKLVDLAAFGETSYTFFASGCFLALMGLFIPFVYIGSFSLAHHIADESISFYTLAIINAASVFGRIVPNVIADKTGPMNVIIPAAVISGVLCFGMIGITSMPPLIIIALLYGFFSGALVSLPPTIYVHLSMQKRHLIGTRMGMGFFIHSIGVLLGTPIAGWILNASSFTFVWLFSGLLLISGAGFMTVARVAKVGSLKLVAKA